MLKTKTLIEQYSNTWTIYLKAKKEFESLTAEAETLRQESDYIGFQLDELVKAGLDETEQEKLESELKIMEHAGEIKTRFQQVLELISSSEYASLNGLGEARNHLQCDFLFLIPI